MSVPARVVFAGGGTGGHLFPGIAIAEAIRALRPDAGISFVGSARRIEARAVPKAGYPFDPIWIAGLQRTFSMSTLLLPVKIVVSLLQSARILRARRPHVVVGTGGYVSAPVVYTAAKLGVRTLIHEQNEHPGLVTRLLSGVADEVHVSFASTLRHLPKARKTSVSGNPVRLSLARMPAEAARSRFGLAPSATTLLVFGGSLGASSINAAVRELLPALQANGIQLIWQTGVRDASDMQRAADGLPGVVVRPFIDEMSAAYSAAELAVCRAGATSIAELTALGIPSILVPYPLAAADHQTKNARALADAGAAELIVDADLGRLAETIIPLFHDAERLSRMADAARRMGRPEAAREIASAVLRMADSPATHREDA